MRGRRWRNTPRLAEYLDELGTRRAPTREVEELSADVLQRERVMLGLRLDEPLAVGDLAAVLDEGALARLVRLGLVERSEQTLALTSRGRFLGGGVTADLLA